MCTCIPADERYALYLGRRSSSLTMGAREMEKRPIWHRPELIAVARSRPEEAVLASCKSSAKGGGNPCYGPGGNPTNLLTAS